MESQAALSEDDVAGYGVRFPDDTHGEELARILVVFVKLTD